MQWRGNLNGGLAALKSICLVIVAIFVVVGALCSVGCPDDHAYPYRQSDYYDRALSDGDLILATKLCLRCAWTFIEDNSDPLIVVFTAILATFTYRLWASTRQLAIDGQSAARAQSRDMKESLRIAEISASAARESADAAGKAAEVAERTLVEFERPYLFVSNVGPIQWAGPPFEPSIPFKVGNYGRVPAIFERIHIGANTSSAPDSPYNLEWGHFLERQGIIGADSHLLIERHDCMGVTDLECIDGMITAGANELFFWAIFDYCGPTKTVVYTRSQCFRFDDDSQTFIPYGGTEYNYEKQCSAGDYEQSTEA